MTGRDDEWQGFPLSPEAEDFAKSARILAEPYEAEIAELRRRLAQVRRDTLDEAIAVVENAVTHSHALFLLRGLRDEAGAE